MPGNKLLLIDGYSIAFRAFFGLPVENFSTATGQPTNAVYGFVAMLITLLRDEQPTHVAVAWDVSRVSFRTVEYADYKGTRDETPPGFQGQGALIQEVLAALRIPSVELDGYEADDILATLATQADASGFEVLVCSGDRDTFQLVTDTVTVLYPRRGTSDLVRMTPGAVEEKYGVPPARYPELAALVGETSDNLPGVPGVGPKTAAKWLTQFDGLDRLLARVDEVPGKAGAALRENLDAVRRNRRLNALVRDLDLSVGPEDLARQPWDAAELTTVLDSLEFRTLRTRLADIGPAAPAPLAPVDVTPTTLAPDGLRPWLTAHGWVAPTGAGGPSGPAVVSDEAALAVAGHEAAPAVAGHEDAPAVAGPGDAPVVASDEDAPVVASDEAAPAVASDEAAPPPSISPDAAAPRWGLEAAGRWSTTGGDLFALALAAPDGAVAWLDVTTSTAGDDRALGAWLADPACPKVAHAVKPALRALWARGLTLAGLTCDTELAAYLFQPDQRGYDLAGLVRQHVGREIEAETSAQAALDVTEPGQRAEAETLTRRAAAVRDLGRRLDQELAGRGGAAELLRDLELPLERILARMEVAGVAADSALLDRLWRDLDDQVRAAERQAHDAIGHPVNLASPKQLQQVLFDELGMPKTRRTKTGYTTDADSLAQLYARNGHPFLAGLLAHRDAIKLRQTVEGLTAAVADDGRIHTTYQQTVAATGRLSSADPNLQNIPVRTPTGRQLREAFVAGPGFEALLTADYSQIEMRIMAHVSGDRSLIEAFQSGRDFHAVTAGRVFGCDPADVTPAQRSKVKAMNYGLAYGLSAFGLSSQLGIGVNEAKVLMDEYFEVFGSVRDYLGRLVAEARQTGYTETILGRRRYLPDLNSTNRTRRDMAERMALNAPIQGSAADIIKRAMIDVTGALAERRLASRLLLQVHDELVFEVAPGEAAALEALVRQAMGHAVALAVPLDVSVGVGPDWRSAAH